MINGIRNFVVDVILLQGCGLEGVHNGEQEGNVMFVRYMICNWTCCSGEGGTWLENVVCHFQRWKLWFSECNAMKHNTIVTKLSNII